MVARKRYTARHVLAVAWGFDYAEVEDYRYHYGHTTRPIYTLGDYYWCAVPIGQKPAQLHELTKDQFWTWEFHESLFAASIGWRVYKSHMNG